MNTINTQHGKIAIIILAAGQSSRLGNPKQLLKINGTSLLQLSMNAALGSNADQVLLVLGSSAGEIKKQLNSDQIWILENPDWESGMSSSLRCGLENLISQITDIEAVILIVCDQPFVSSDLLNELIRTYQSGDKDIIASFYDDIPGTPALFHKSMFQDLLSLKGDKGARMLFTKFAAQTGTIPFKEGSIDIDTLENYKNLAK